MNLIILIAVFLRFFRIPENLVFHGELGHNYLAIKNFIASGQIPLLGPPTSHPWLSFGPLFYWLFAPILAIFKFDPMAGGYFFAFVGALAVILNYFVVRSLFDKKVALISSFLLAISPAWISLAREARFFSLVTLFFYHFFYFFVRGIQKKGKGFLWAGLFFGIMLNFHLTPIILIPPIFLILYFKRSRIVRKEFLKGLAGIAIPSLPFFIYNLTHKFEMLVALISWIPYRILGFIGLYPKNTVTPEVVGHNLTSFYDFVRTNLIAVNNDIAFLLFVLILGFIFLKKKRTVGEAALLLFLIFGYLGIFIHGNPPYHYYLPLYSIPAIFAGIAFTQLFRRSWGAVLASTLIIYITFANIRFYYSDSWFFKNNPFSFAQQKKAAAFIIKDAKGEAFTLKRKGENDNFEGNYAQNYRYLLWWMGNEPTDMAKLNYTVIEDADFGIVVLKEKLKP